MHDAHGYFITLIAVLGSNIKIVHEHMDICSLHSFSHVTTSSKIKLLNILLAQHLSLYIFSWWLNKLIMNRRMKSVFDIVVFLLFLKKEAFCGKKQKTFCETKQNGKKTRNQWARKRLQSWNTKSTLLDEQKKDNNKKVFINTIWKDHFMEVSVEIPFLCI